MSLLSGTFLPLHRASETEASYYNPTCLIKSKIKSQDYFFKCEYTRIQKRSNHWDAVATLNTLI